MTRLVVRARFVVTAAALMWLLTSVGARAQDSSMLRVQQTVQQMMVSEIGGQLPSVSFNPGGERQMLSFAEVRVRGTGTYRRYPNDSGAPFTFEGTFNAGTNTVKDCHYSLRGAFSPGSNAPTWNSGGTVPTWNGGANVPAGYGVQAVQSSVQEQLRRETGRDVSFNNDARSTAVGNNQVRVEGTGVMWRNGRERAFAYSGLWNGNGNRVRDLQIQTIGNGNNGNGRNGRVDADRVIDSNNISQTYEGFGNIIVLNGNNCNLVITGEPREVRINGRRNRIRIEGRVTAIVTPGADNFIRWNASRNPVRPQILNTGRANDIGSY